MTEPRQHVFRHLPGELAQPANIEPRTHVFRHPDKTPVLAYREWARANLPHSSEGVVVDDMDMIVRTWGPSYNTGAFGKFRLIEIKYASAWPTIGQMITFKGIDELLRRGDPGRHTYLGFYVVQHWTEDWTGDFFEINSQTRLDTEAFKSFLLGTTDLPGYEFDRIKMKTGIK